MTRVQCLKCGYDLRASIDSDRCPECGVRIEVMNIPFRARREPTMRGFLLHQFLFVIPLFCIVLLNASGKLPLSTYILPVVLSLFAIAFVVRFIVQQFVMKKLVRRWPFEFELLADGVQIKHAQSGKGRKDRFFGWSTLRHARHVRGATGLPCIRLGTGLFLHMLEREQAFEIDCHKAEASLIHAEIVHHIEKHKE